MRTGKKFLVGFPTAHNTVIRRGVVMSIRIEVLGIPPRATEKEDEEKLLEAFHRAFQAMMKQYPSFTKVEPVCLLFLQKVTHHGDITVTGPQEEISVKIFDVPALPKVPRELASRIHAAVHRRFPDAKVECKVFTEKCEAAVYANT
jgi:hypothetical protein